jgi:carotenoid cleavage dioxygenase-like enzyme
LTPIETKFNAKIPSWINGNLICNGPGKFTVGDHKLNHLYDGMAVLQQFRIQPDGKVTYKNKFVQSEAHVRGCNENRILFGEFGTKPTSHQSSGVLSK